MFAKVRRQDRLLEQEQISFLLGNAEYGFLSMIGTNGFGYGIPLNFVREDEHIYFHCAPEGYKLDCLKGNPNVSFCVVGQSEVIPGKFTTAYESVVAFGKACFNLPEEERKHALRLLVKKYSPDFEEAGEKAIEKSLNRTQIIRLDIEHVTGKCKRIH